MTATGVVLPAVGLEVVAVTVPLVVAAATGVPLAGAVGVLAGALVLGVVAALVAVSARSRQSSCSLPP